MRRGAAAIALSSPQNANRHEFGECARIKARGGLRPKNKLLRDNSQDSRDSRSEALHERNRIMATKTQTIEVKVDEELAGKIAGKAVRRWHATAFSDGKKRVYVTFEEVKTVGAGA